MSRKSSLPQDVKSVSVVLTPDSGTWSDLSIDHNEIRGLYAGVIRLTYDNRCCVITALHGVEEQHSSITNTSINDNSVVTAESGSNAIQFDLRQDRAYSGEVGDVSIARNTVIATTGSLATAIFARSTAVPSGRVFVRGNMIGGYAHAFHVEFWANATISGNNVQDISKGIVLESNNLHFDYSPKN